MKDLKIILIALLVLPFLFLSCEKDENITGNPAPPQLDLRSGFSGVGQKHNDGMARIYQKLLNSRPLREESSVLIAKKEAKAYLEANDSYSDDAIFDLNYTTDFTSATELYPDLSPELKAELIILENTFDTYVDNGRIGDFLRYTEQIINDVPSTLRKDEDRIAWQHAVEVMGYSSDYWNNNFIDWLKLNPDFDESMLQSRGGGFWRGLWNAIKPVVKADAIGAAKGAVKGFFKGLISGGIHGAVVGAGGGALSGGLEGSAGKALEGIWEWITG